MSEQREQTFAIGGDMTVSRLGFGAMRITGSGVWGWPADRAGARALLRRARERGVDLIDTADAYGPETSEYLIAEEFRPYPEGLVIATKGGLVRGGPGSWTPDGRPEHLVRAVENSLRRLGREVIDLYQLHTIDDAVPLEDSVGALKEMKDAGKIRHVGVSNFRVEHIERARRVTEVVTVQNRYSLSDRKHEDVVDYCTEHGIGFIPWYPLGTGKLTSEEGLRELAGRYAATPGQIALAWLLERSPVVLPIPGTSSIEHLEENLGARDLELSSEDFEALSQKAF